MNQIQLTHALLKYTRPIDLLSTVLLLMTIGILFMIPFIFAVNCLLLIGGGLGISLKYISLKLSFDQQVFAHFSQLSTDDLEQQTIQMNASLARLKLISAPHNKNSKDSNTDNNWDQRCQSTILLIRTQFIMCCLQGILLLLACSLIYI